MRKLSLWLIILMVFIGTLHAQEAEDERITAEDLATLPEKIAIAAAHPDDENVTLLYIYNWRTEELTEMGNFSEVCATIPDWYCGLFSIGELAIPIDIDTFTGYDWSPAKSDVVFVDNDDEGKGNIWLYKDGLADPFIQLTDTPEHEYNPQWSPDFEFILYSREGAIWIMDMMGERQTTLLEIEAFDMGWSPMLGNADVDFVRAVKSGETWTLHVTVRHPDTGWEDYADGWDVVLPDGTVLKPDANSPFTRLLLHPHETEQPFTRSQGGLIIPDDVTNVTVRAHDLVDGWGGQTVEVDLTADAGENFTVEH